MVDTYIVTIEDFRNRANISSNLLTPRFKQESGIEQERFGIKILCNELYNEVLTEIENDTYTPEIEALLPYLRDYLVFKIYASYLVDGNYISTPAGMRTQVDDTSTAVSREGMAQVIQKAESRANFYQDKLVNFLKCNEDDYPSWKDSNCGCKHLRVNKSNSFTKIGSSKGYTKIKWT